MSSLSRWQSILTQTGKAVSETFGTGKDGGPQNFQDAWKAPQGRPLGQQPLYCGSSLTQCK